MESCIDVEDQIKRWLLLETFNASYMLKTDKLKYVKWWSSPTMHDQCGKQIEFEETQVDIKFLYSCV
jgi:hypothetical protein